MSRITHEATVVDIVKDTIILELIRTEACGNCSIKEICHKKKNLQAKVDNPQEFANGQKVNVFIAEKQAFTAIFLGYVLPLILVLLSLFITLHFTKDEVLAATCSLIIFPLYFLVLYKFNKKLQKVLSVSVEQP